MLRPSGNLLDSSRATYRASLRAERLKGLWQIGRLLKSMVTGAAAALADLFLLLGLPLAYLFAAYLVIDLPARWLAHKGAYGRWGLLLFAASLAIACVGVIRARRNAEPIAPVRPVFAKVMLGVSWVVAILCTIGDLAR